jgi:hypothetical protein
LRGHNLFADPILRARGRKWAKQRQIDWISNDVMVPWPMHEGIHASAQQTASLEV